MKNRFLSFLSAALAAVMLAGCSAEGPETTHTPAPQPEEDPIYLSYWCMWEETDPQSKVISMAADAFAYETNIHVDIKYMGQDKSSRDQLKDALEAGECIDIFDDKIETLTRDFKPWLTSLGQRTTEYEYTKTASPELLKAARDINNGELLFLPYQPYAMVFFYNRDIFHRAGIEAPPTTWDEFLDVCQRVKTAGYIPIACDDAFMELLVGHHLGRLEGQTAVESIIGRHDWDHPAFLRLAEDYATLARRGYFSPTVETNVWPYSQNEEMATGKAAMYFSGSWLPHDLLPITGDDFPWGCFPYPVLEGGRFGMDSLNYSSMGLAINKGCSQPDAAFRFIQYLTKGAVDSQLSVVSHSIPVDRSNSAWPRELTQLRPVLQNVQYHWTWGAGIDYDPAVTPILTKNIQLLCACFYTADEFVAAMEADTAHLPIRPAR